MTLGLNLYRLQQVDARLGQARARERAIQEALDNDEETRSARSRAQAAQETDLRAENALRAAQYETQETRVKIQQAESSLYGGRVNNPKELQDLQKDIDSLKRHLAALEDRELEAMIAVEDAQQADSVATSGLDNVLLQAETKTQGLRAEQTHLASEIARLETERQAIAGSVDARSLEEYDLLFRQKRGVAVASLVDGACSACGAPLTPAQRQAVHIGERLEHCPSCGRVLYAG